MRIRRSKYFVVVSVLISCLSAYSWGFKAHQKITQIAIFSLPSEMIKFYKSHWDDLKQASIQPDIRRYVWDDEKPRHYIDLDLYSKIEQDSLMKGWNVASGYINADTLFANGTLPFALETTMHRLTQAFRERSGFEIIRYSGDLAHYVGDAHVPLHTTVNYNGHLTGQRGIHALWESRIPEQELLEYSFWQNSAEYIPGVRSKIWEIIYASHSKVDSVLDLERYLSQQFKEDQKYTFKESGKSTIKTYSKSYISEFSVKLNGMVERQMQAAAQSTADMWFTCWVNAGQPKLVNLNFEKEALKKDSINSHDLRSVLHH